MSEHLPSRGNFFGRKRILELLGKRFEAFQEGYRHNVGLIGSPYVGKTSILAEFLNRQASSSVVHVYVRVDEGDLFPVFCQKWMGGILLGCRKFLGATPSTHFQDLFKALRRRFPSLAKRMRDVKQLAENEQFDQSFRALLELTHALHEVSGERVLLVVDEVERFKQFPLSDPFVQLGSVIMFQKHTMFIVTSSQPTQAREMFREKLSLLFSNFEIVEVGHFDFEEADEWLAARFPDSFDDDMLRWFFVYLTNGHPCYLQMLSNKLDAIRLERGKNQIDQDAFFQVLEDELFLPEGTLHQHFMICIMSVSRNRAASVYGDVLLAIALGKKKVNAMAAYLKRPMEEIKKILQRLLAENCIEKNGAFFSIPDFCFRFWLAEAYGRRRASFDVDEAPMRGAFRHSLNRFFEVVRRESETDLTLRIENLFRHFRNEMIQFRSSKIRCPRFTDIAVKPTNGRMFPVRAKNQTTNWLCQVVRGRLDEDDVRLFLHDVKQSSSPVQRKVMIALRGSELNAKLLAKENRIQLWDLRDLNQLLDLYGCAKVMQ